jgi:hypothetical protein
LKAVFWIKEANEVIGPPPAATSMYPGRRLIRPDSS